MAEMVTVTGLDEQMKRFDRMLSSDPGMKRRVQACIRTVLKEVRSKLTADARSGLRMQSDPRQAYKAVRTSVYKRIFGGQVNILSPRRASGGGGGYEPERHPAARGGNRMKRSQRTQDIMNYTGKDRGFVLRFLNDGTQDRYAGFGRNGNNSSQRNAYLETNSIGRGYRGRIKARNWFGRKSTQELEAASAQLQGLIDDVVNKYFQQ